MCSLHEKYNWKEQENPEKSLCYQTLRKNNNSECFGLNNLKASKYL